MAFSLITVTADYDAPDGTDPIGTVSFTPEQPMVNGDTVVAAPVTRSLTFDGLLVIQLAANTDPGTVPVGVQYLVQEAINGVTRSYYVSVPHNVGTSIALTDLEPGPD